MHSELRDVPPVSSPALTDRDPGVYNVTGEWLAHEGTLEMAATVAPFDDPRADVTSPGFSDTEGTDVLPQFAHGWPALLGTVDGALGTRAMLLTPALIGALALLAFAAFASTWLRPTGTAAAVALLAANLPFLYFTRDAYSEPLVLVFVFGGLWLLTAPSGPDAAVGGRSLTARVLGAFVLAAACTVRIDAVFVLAAIGIVAVASWRAGRRSDAAIVLAAGALPMVVAVVDLAWRSPDYLAYQRGELLAALGLTLAVGVAALIGPPLAARLDGRRPDWRRIAGWTAAGAVALVAFWFVALRPEVVGVRGSKYPRFIEALQRWTGETP